jgi:hypothetical protein
MKSNGNFRQVVSEFVFPMCLLTTGLGLVVFWPFSAALF